MPLFRRFCAHCTLRSCDNVRRINKRLSRISRITGDALRQKCANGAALNDLRAHCAHIKSNFSYYHPRLYIRMFFIFHSLLLVRPVRPFLHIRDIVCICTNRRLYNTCLYSMMFVHTLYFSSRHINISVFFRVLLCLALDLPLCCILYSMPPPPVRVCHTVRKMFCISYNSHSICLDTNVFWIYRRKTGNFPI